MAAGEGGTGRVGRTDGRYDTAAIQQQLYDTSYHARTHKKKKQEVSRFIFSSFENDSVDRLLLLLLETSTSIVRAYMITRTYHTALFL